MAENLISSPAYRVAFSMYVALGGDPNMTFDSVDAIYAAIDELYGKGTRVTIENLSVEITENGGYLYDNEEITGYKPVSVNVSVPQKYTDEQVESLKETARQEGYDSGYELGVSDGFTQGEADGYNDGYAEGLEDGAADQKELLEDITITDNGVYEKEDGYKKVTVDIEKGIPEEEVDILLETARDEGYNNGVAQQKSKLETTTIINNGTYTKEDGWNEVIVDVPISGDSIDIAEELGYEDNTINVVNNNKILSNIDYTKSLASSYVKPTNGKLTAKYYNDSKLVYCPNIDISGITNFGSNTFNQSTSSNYGAFQGCSNLLYVPLNFSSATLMGYTFSNCGNLITIKPFDASNVTNAAGLFYGCHNLTEVPFIKTPTALTDTSRMFFGCFNLKNIPHIDTSNCTYVNYMYSGCKNLEGTIEMDLTSCTNQFCSTSTSSASINGESIYFNPFYKCNKIDTIKLLNINPALTVFYGCFKTCGVKHVEMTWQEGWAPTDISFMFAECYSLEDIPNFDLSKVTACSGAFTYCSKLKSVPTQNYQSLAGSKSPALYSGCAALETFNGDINYPLLTASSINTSQFSQAFQSVTCDIPNVNVPVFNGVIYEIFNGYKGKSIGNLYSPSANRISLGLSAGDSINIESLGEIHCDACTSLTIFKDYSAMELTNMTNFGGFINYGKTSSANSLNSQSNGLYRFPNLTHSSLMNVINNLYDRASAGYSVLTLELHANALALLSEEEIAIATNKGWTIS